MHMEHLAAQQLGQSVILAAGDKHLPPRDAVQDELLPTGIQLAEYIVQQQHRILSGDIFVNLPLRQLQGQGRRPGLPLGGILLGVPAVDGDQQVILVRPRQAQPGGPLRDLVGFHVVPQLLRQCGNVRRR